MNPLIFVTTAFVLLAVQGNFTEVDLDQPSPANISIVDTGTDGQDNLLQSTLDGGYFQLANTNPQL